MLRFAMGVVASGTVLLTSGAAHVLASWALPAAGGTLTFGALVAVVAMEGAEPDRLNPDRLNEAARPLRMVPPGQGADGT